MQATDIFNIISMHIPISRSDLSLFEAHFTYTPAEEFQLIVNSEVHGTVHQTMAGRFIVKGVRSEDIQKAIDKYLGMEQMIKDNALSFELERKQKEEEAEQKRLRENPLGYMNTHKPFRTIDISGMLPPIPDQNSFKN